MMIRKKFGSVTAIAALAVVLVGGQWATSATASVITDGDFEVITGSADQNSDYSFGAWTVGDPNKLGADGWQNTTRIAQGGPGNDQIYTRANNNNRSGADVATSGVDLVTFHGGNREWGEIFQTLTTTSGTTYEVAFDLRAAESTTDNFKAQVFNGLLDLTSGSSRSSVDMISALGGTTIASVANTTWTNYSFSFTATGTTSTLSFLSYSPDGHEVDLDTVTVVEGEVTGVPEPISFAAGLFGLTLVAIRRRLA